MIATAQRQLPIVISETRKLLDLRFAKAAFGCDEDSALAMIETGQIAWAFDISSGDKLREVRVLRECLPPAVCGFTELDQVIDHIIPAGRAAIRSSELCAWWDCGRDLLDRAMKNGLLGGHVNGHTLWISAESAREFLKRRRIS